MLKIEVTKVSSKARETMARKRLFVYLELQGACSKSSVEASALSSSNHSVMLVLLFTEDKF
jgi:hypothetical protein